MKIQELNYDGSPRLDDNGQPIFQYVSDATYYELMETPVGQKHWKRVNELKVEHANGLIEGSEESKELIKGIGEQFTKPLQELKRNVNRKTK